MSTTLFEHLANSDVMWICPSCDVPNYSAVLFTTPIVGSGENQYEALADSMRSQVSSLPDPISIETLSMDHSSFFSLPMSPTDLSHQSLQSIGAPIGASSPRTLVYQPKRNRIKDNLKVAIVNCQSICNKVMEFNTFLDVTMPDIILGTESWLKPEIGNPEIFPPDFNVFRRDRQHSQKKSGGGVFILVKKESTCSEVKLDIACEFVAVKLELKGQKHVTIGCFYRPPWVDDSYMTDFTETLDNINPGRDGNIWIGGDFNLPRINWETMATTPGNTTITQSEILLQSTGDHSLTQVVNYDTRKGSTLDLLFTTAPPLRNNGTLYSDPKDKADILNKQYCSVFTADSSQPPSKGPSPYDPSPNIKMSTEGIHKLLTGLNPNKACGPDKITPQLLRRMADRIAEPLTNIFRSSIAQGTVPWQWRNALVSPIFKKGDKHSAANYRPVSLTSVCCKLCEHIVWKSIMSHLNNNDIR